MNLLKETIEDIEDIGKTIEDIIFIGSLSSGHCCTWSEFCDIANFEYDNGYGSQEVATDLKIVFKDMSYLARCEYDGSECWSYFKTVEIPTNKKSIKRLTKRSYMTLGEMNEV